MKALARYQVILLGEQRHIRCEQLAPRVQRATATLPVTVRRGHGLCLTA